MDNDDHQGRWVRIDSAVSGDRYCTVSAGQAAQRVLGNLQISGAGHRLERLALHLETARDRP